VRAHLRVAIWSAATRRRYVSAPKKSYALRAHATRMAALQTSQLFTSLGAFTGRVFPTLLLHSFATTAFDCLEAGYCPPREKTGGR